jgi:hypothetical protein
VANEVEIVVKARDRTKDGFASVTRGLGRLGAGAMAAIKPLASVGAGIAAIGSLAGPAVSGLLAIAKGVVAVGKAAAGLAPLVATLPALAGGLGLIIGTAKLAGPAMGKAVEPIAKAFARLGDEVGALASRDLPRLSREFVKVNFPSIRTAMRDIAESMNFVVRETGAWVNSASGQQAIRQITEATAGATKRLEGPLSRVVVSFGEMVKRVGGGAIGKVADQMIRLAEATIRWMDSISNEDVNKAGNSLAGWGGKLKDTFIVLRDVGTWMSENEAKVKAFSDVLAGAAITLGIATGNIPAIVAGSFALVVNHWDTVKEKLKDGQNFISQAWSQAKDDPAFRGFVDSFKKATTELGEKWDKFAAKVKEVWQEWGPILKAFWDGVGRPVLSALGTTLGFLIEHFVTSMTVSAEFFRRFGEGLKNLWAVASSVFGNFINGAATAFGWMPGIGPKLEKAAADFNAFRDRVNAALDSINDEDVYINIKQRGTPGVTGSNEAFNLKVGRRAHGGVTGGGWTELHEMGREAVRLPSGATVIPHGQTEQMINSGTARSKLDLVVSVAPGSGRPIQKAMAELVLGLIRTGELRLSANGSPVIGGR